MDLIKREVLEELGLTKNEIEVYLTLMRLGSTTAGIISKECCLHRRNVYDALEKLIQKGIVGYVKNNKTKHFETTNPKRILDLLKERRIRIQETEKRFESSISQFISLNNTRNTQDVSIYQGREGRKIVFQDIIENASENRVLGGYAPTPRAKVYMNSYNKKRARLGIKNFMIYNKSNDYLDFLKSLDNTEIRLLPQKLNSKTTFNIYNNNVAILFNIHENPITILIKNPSVASDFREYFDFLWNISQSS